MLIQKWEMFGINVQPYANFSCLTLLGHHLINRVRVTLLQHVITKIQRSETRMTIVCMGLQSFIEIQGRERYS